MDGSSCGCLLTWNIGALHPWERWQTTIIRFNRRLLSSNDYGEREVSINNPKDRMNFLTSARLNMSDEDVRGFERSSRTGRPSTGCSKNAA